MAENKQNELPQQTQNIQNDLPQNNLPLQQQVEQPEQPKLSQNLSEYIDELPDKTFQTSVGGLVFAAFYKFI